MSIREIVRIVDGVPASDGAGVRLLRIIGSPQCDSVDPFLLLDEFRNDDPNAYVAGFPDHPHRGFETVTYMMKGRMRHRDSVGNSGLLTDGSVQWMTAGRGIIHSEMPEQTDGLIWGYQLWVNVPAEHKMTAPRYQDISSDQIPEAEADGALVRILAGSWNGHQGAAETIWPASYLDVRLRPEAEFDYSPADGHTLMAFAYDGGFSAPGPSGPQTAMRQHQLAIFARNGSMRLQAGAEGAGLLVMEGAPINEPIARMGPFVMNTRQELLQAAEDYRAGRLA